jgi:hypothetical protein
VEYLDLLRFSNGGEGPLALAPLYFMLYEVELVVEINGSEDQDEIYPGHFVFGSNGGLETIAFDTRGGTPWSIVMYDAVAGIESRVVVAKDMADFLGAVGVDDRE